MRKVKTITIGILACLMLAPVAQALEETLEGKVVEILEEKTRVIESVSFVNQTVLVHITKGSIAGQEIRISQEVPNSNTAMLYKPGEKLLIYAGEDIDGNPSYSVSDYIRSDALYWLFGVFVVLTVLVAGKRGVLSLLGMAYSLFIVFKFILPQIVSGQEPVITAITGAVLIVPVTFYLSHGWSKKTHVAITGTIIALGVTIVLAQIAISSTKLLGIGQEEAMYLHSGGATLDLRGILLAGIIIALVGILDDVTISQASVVAELKSANSKLHVGQIFIRAMRVGNDHIASLVNTLVLVYAGAALPLFLLFTQNPSPLSQVINYEPIAEEIVRTLVGSIGLIMAVPITTLLAAFAFGTSKK